MVEKNNRNQVTTSSSACSVNSASNNSMSHSACVRGKTDATIYIIYMASFISTNIICLEFKESGGGHCGQFFA